MIKPFLLGAIVIASLTSVLMTLHHNYAHPQWGTIKFKLNKNQYVNLTGECLHHGEN